MQQLKGPHQIGGKSGFNCTTCHDPHGTLTARTKEDQCLSCHKGPLAGEWHSARHNEAGLQCTDCHDAHPSVGPQTIEELKQGKLTLASLPQPMAASRDSCYRCHGDSYRLQEFTGPHRIAPGSAVQLLHVP